MNLLRTDKPATLVFCTFDKNRPDKCGLRRELKNVTYSSNEGYRLLNVRLANGEVQSMVPVLIEKYNGTIVTP